MQFLLAIFLIWPSSDDEIKEKIQILHHEAKVYLKTHPDTTIFLVSQALTNSREAYYVYGEAKSLALLGDIANRQNKPSQAATYFLNALQRYDGLDDEKSLSDQAKICTTLGKIYREHYKVKEAIEYYDKGLEFAVSADDQKAFLILLHNKSIAYRKLGDLAKAKELLTLKLEAVKEDHLEEKMYTYNQLGLVHSDLKAYDQSLSYYNKILELEKEEEASLHRGQAYHNMANIYQAQNDYTKAWDYFHQALSELETLGSPKELFITHQDMAELALTQGRPTLALFYAQKASPFLDQLPKTPDYYDQYLLLSRCYRTIDSSQSYVNTDFFAAKGNIFNALQEELIAQGKAYKMDLITTTYLNAINKHEQQIRLYWTIACSLLFLFIAGYISIRLRKIYRYRSPEVALNLIKSPNEMLYLLDMFRNEKEELKRTRRQEKRE